jgi:hypothetical protein
LIIFFNTADSAKAIETDALAEKTPFETKYLDNPCSIMNSGTNSPGPDKTVPVK